MAMLKIQFVDPPESQEELREFQYADMAIGPATLFHPRAIAITTDLRRRAIELLNREAHKAGGSFIGHIAFQREQINSEDARYFVLAKLVPIQPGTAVMMPTADQEIVPASAS